MFTLVLHLHNRIVCFVVNLYISICYSPKLNFGIRGAGSAPAGIPRIIIIFLILISTIINQFDAIPTKENLIQFYSVLWILLWIIVNLNRLIYLSLMDYFKFVYNNRFYKPSGYNKNLITRRTLILNWLICWYLNVARFTQFAAHRWNLVRFRATRVEGTT